MRNLPQNGLPVETLVPTRQGGKPLPSSLSIWNIHAGIQIVSSSVDEAPVLAIAGKDLLDRVKSAEVSRPLLDGLRFGDLIERNACVVAAVVGRSTIGCLHHHVDEEGVLTIRGMAVDPDWSGLKLASAMTATAILHAGIAFSEPHTVQAFVRVLANGQLNMPSAMSFARLGFIQETATYRGHLTGDYHTRHLLSGSEHDDEGRPFVRMVRMVADRDIYAAARTFVHRWSREILPIASAEL